MKNQIKFLFLLFWGVAMCASAANNTKGIDYYKAGQQGPAKTFFEEQLKTQTGANLAEVYYYLGEIAYDQKNTQEAFGLYKKGLETAPEYPYNRVGMGKVLLAGNDKKGAQNEFNQALSKDKKDLDVQLAIGYAYLANKMIPEAQEKVEVVRKINKTYGPLYLFEGDINYEQNKIAEAVGRYDQAIYFDPQCKEAYLKYARVFYTLNADAAIEKLNELLAKNPGYTVAHRELGEIYYHQRQYKKAIEEYKTYFAGGIYSQEDQNRYAAILYYSKEYNESLKVVNEGLQKNPDNIVLKRLQVYNNYELKEYQAGLTNAQQLIALAGGDDTKLIGMDYLYYGRLLTKEKKTAEAIVQLEKAVKLDSMRVDAYKEIALAYQAENNNVGGVKFYNLYLEKMGDYALNSDYFDAGNYACIAASEIKGTSPEEIAEKKAILEKADKYFAVVEEKAPQSHVGPYWRGRVQAMLDPTLEQGLAKPYYEKAISIIEGANNQQKHKADLIDCYRYMGAYLYYIKNSPEESKVYWEKILALDPNDKGANDAMKWKGMK